MTFQDIIDRRNISCRETMCSEDSHQLLAQLVEARCLEERMKNNPLWLVDDLGGQNAIGWTGEAILQVINSQLLNKNRFKKFSQLHATKHNQRKRDSINQLAEQFSYTDICFPEKNNYVKNPLPCRYITQTAAFTCRYWPKHLMLSSQVFICNKYIVIENPAGNPVGCLVEYQTVTGSKLFIPGRIASSKSQYGMDEYFFEPGYHKPLWLLLRETELENMPNATVFLCEDIQVAEELNGIIKDSKRIESGTFIATSPMAGRKAIEHTDFEGLRSKNVIYIPSPVKSSYHTAHSYKEKCATVGVKSFKVLPYPALCHQLTAENEAITALTDPWERYVLQQAVILPKEESQVLYQLEKDALDWEAYHAWGQHIGIFALNGQEIKSQSSIVTGTQLLQWDSERLCNSSPDMYCFAAPKEIGVIIADQNVGKTRVAMSIALTKACGKGWLNYTPVAPEKVLVLDVETGTERLAAMVQKFCISEGYNTELVGQNFFLRCLRDENDGTPIDLMNTQLQESIREDILTKGIQLVIMDNLLGLFPGMRNSGGTRWQECFKFIRDMEQEFNVSFLIVHHSNTQGGAAGTKDIEAQCHNIIHLENQRGKSPAPDSPFDEFYQKQGALFSLDFKKCKRYPQLENKPFGVFLSNEVDWPSSTPRWVKINLSEDAGEVTTEAIVSHWPDRTAEEQNMLELIKKQQVATRSQVDSLLGCSESKSNGLLKKLCDDKLIDKIGEGKQTRYTLRT